jgi:hypothetical protein
MRSVPPQARLHEAAKDNDTFHRGDPSLSEMGAGKNHAQGPLAVDIKLEEAEDAAIAPHDEGRKSATTTNPHVMLYLTSKSVGSRKDASCRKHASRSGKSG